MRIRKYYITLIFLLLSALSAYSQEVRTEICIDFRVNCTYIDSTYMDNAARVREMVDFLQEIQSDSTINILEVSFCGTASPEGSYQLNRNLARERMATMERYVRERIDIPDSIITRDDAYISWDYFKRCIEESDYHYRNQVLEILEEDEVLVDYHTQGTHIDSRIQKLKQLEGGKVWDQMHAMFFEQMRNACAVFVTYKSKSQVQPEETQPVQEVKTETAVVEPVDTVEVKACPETPSGWTRKLHVKTDALGLGMAMANAALEVDVIKHLSVSIPVYYSAWNYFKSTIKFRTLAFQPELRYWISEENDGLFVGAHFGLAYYNFAFDGPYRYQDHNRETPAVGGGLSAGYRLPLSRNDRLRVEFSLGAGVYALHYDRFHNTPVTTNGLLIDSTRDIYFGLDHVSVSFSYAFDLKRKGGRR